MHFFWKISALIKNYMIWAIVITVTLAIFLGANFDLTFLKNYITPIAIYIIYPLMIGISFDTIHKFDDGKLLLIALVANLLIIPLIGFGVSQLFFTENIVLATGMILVSTLPTSGGMTIAWTSLADGNMKSSVKMNVFGMLFGAVFAPLFVKLFLGTSIEMPLAKVLIQIFYVIIIPLIFGQITRYFILKRQSKEEFKKNIKPKLGLLSNWGLLLIIFSAVSLKAKAIVANKIIIVDILVPLLLFYITTYIIVSLIGKYLLERKDAISLIYASSLRGLGIALVLALTVLGEKGAEIAFFVALAFIIQIKLASFSLKLNKKIFNL